MAKFAFRFEQVLRHRRLTEEQRQRVLAQFLRQRMTLRDELVRMQRTISESKREMSSALVGRVDLDQVSRFGRYNYQVIQRAQAIVHRLAGVERQISHAREQLIEATRDRKALELLRDRYYERWRREQQRRENVAADEIAVQSFGREALVGDRA